MAEVFRPVYTAIDPKTGQKVRKKSPTWWIRYYTPDGERHKVKGYKDKKATEALAADLERRGQRLAAGLADPTDEHAKRPLAEHAEDFRRYLVGEREYAGACPPYVALRSRLSGRLPIRQGCRRATVGRGFLPGDASDRRQKHPHEQLLPDRYAGFHPAGCGEIGELQPIRWPACRNWRTRIPTCGTLAEKSHKTN